MKEITSTELYYSCLKLASQEWGFHYRQHVQVNIFNTLPLCLVQTLGEHLYNKLDLKDVTSRGE